MSDTTLRERQTADGAAFDIIEGWQQAAHYGDTYAEYQAALTGAALSNASGRGRLWMSDRDRAELLQRLSTNDMVKLQPGQGAQTVLTNHNGRIIDLLTVHAMEDRMLLVTSPQQRGAVRNLLRKNIFFNDKVKLEDVSETLGQLNLYGPQSAALIETLTGTSVEALPLHGITAATANGTEVWVARLKPIGGACFAIYAPGESLPALWDALRAGGAHPLGSAAFSMLRIEAGYGAFGRELSLEYIPLETGLNDAISFSKGCYVGQEIIARMESRGRMAKKLRGLKLSGMPPIDPAETDDEQVLPKMPLARLSVDGKEAGDLTSVAVSPRFGTIGLAYVRSAHAEPGTVVGMTGSDVTGTVVELPFE